MRRPPPADVRQRAVRLASVAVVALIAIATAACGVSDETVTKTETVVQTAEPAPAPADAGTSAPEAPAADEIIAELQRATVQIRAYDADGTELLTGSGTIIDPRGYILTNAHVADPQTPGLWLNYGPSDTPTPATLEVSMVTSADQPATPTYLAETLAADGWLDVAVLQVTATIDGTAVYPDDLPTAEIGSTAAIDSGDELTVIGFPGIGGSEEGSVDASQGIVSGFLKDDREQTGRGWIKTDARVAPGNSGGLAADAEGRLIGIPSSLRSDAEAAVAAGRIRPIELAQPVIDAALAGEPYTSPYLVAATGAESVAFAYWTDDCDNGEAVEAFEAYAGDVVAVWRIDGMAAGEDYSMRWWHYDTVDDPEPELVASDPGRWDADWGSGTELCESLELPAEPGWYQVEVALGPSLAVSDSESVEVVG